MTDIKDIKAAKDRVVEHLKDRHPCLVLDEEGVITEVRGSSGQARWSSGLVIRSSGEVDWQLFDLLAGEDPDEEQERRILDLYSFVSGEILDRSIPNDMRTTRIISNHLRYVLSDEDLEFLLDYLDTLEGPDLSDKKSVLSWWSEWWTIVLSVLDPEEA